MDSQALELITVIADWLEQERAVCLRAAIEHGIEPSVAISEPVAEEVTETSYRIHSVPINVTPLAIPVLAWQLVDTLGSRDENHDSPAGELYEHYGACCKVWDLAGAHAFDDDPVKWIHDRLLTPIRHEYLAALGSLEHGRPDLANEFARDFLELFEHQTVDFVAALPVGGIQLAEDPVKVENVRCRTLTARELARIADGANYPTWRERRSLSSSPPGLTLERSVLEVRTQCDKLQQPRGEFHLQKLVLALQLLKFELHGRGFATTWTEPGPSRFSGGQQLRLAERGGTKVCTAEELERALRIAKQIPDGAILRPRDRKELVLHRFLLGSTDESKTDALIDYTISLEAFLLPPSKYGEYRFKFAFFGSWYLGSDNENRSQLFGDLTEIYDMRSEIVHGGGLPADQLIDQIAAKARELSSRMITKAVEEHWPSPTELKHIALG